MTNQLRHIALSIFMLVVFSLMNLNTRAQHSDSTVTVLELLVVDGDTIPVCSLNEFAFKDLAPHRSKRYQKRYGRIRKKVIRAYPYAKVTHELLDHYDEQLASLNTEKEKKQYLDLAEAELKEEFEGEIRNLTVTEGKILIKLIDRETGDTSYELIKKLKGGFSAFMYQSIARLFGSNLKSQYDADGDDRIIEEIVQQIESGEIYVPPKQPVTTKAQKRLQRKQRREQRKLKKQLENEVAQERE